MYIEIKAQLMSPLMIGGKTLSSNYRESKPFIPGSVLRAAYAKAIIERCPYTHKNYWLDYQAKEECTECSQRYICKEFAKLHFPTLYPMGGRPYPLTARRKKYSSEDDIKAEDILRHRLRCKGRLKKESQLVRLEGFHVDGQEIEMIHTMITKSAVDYNRRSTKSGALYSQNLLSEELLVGKKKMNTCFKGKMHIDEGQMEGFQKLSLLRVGADITKGMGRCQISCAEVDPPDSKEDMAERIEKFNAGELMKDSYITIDLVTDAYLELESFKDDNVPPSTVSDEVFSEFLRKQIGLPSKYQLQRVYKNQEVLRGFNTAKETVEAMRRKGSLVVKAGAVFVFQVEKGMYDLDELFDLEQQGIGKHTEHGFGQIEICDDFHVKYDVMNEGRGV